MYTYSSEFLSKCETLKDYMTFVNKVRIKTDIEKLISALLLQRL